jgi:UDP-glucose 4-epimerase
VIAAVERVISRRVPWSPAARRPGDPATLVASAQSARRVLGWSPDPRGLDHIIESSWRWRTAHPNGYAVRAEHQSTRQS